MEPARVETADGLFLDGALYRPQHARPFAVDAFLLIHGTGSNFYSPGLLERFALQAVAHGTSALRINTRGHDGICSIPSRRGSVKGGAAYERIGECPLDVTAWMHWLLARGFTSIALVGHSLGGVKAIYSQVQAHHPAVRAVVGISPPRFSHERLLAHARGEDFRASLSRAGELIAQGHGETLVTVTQPLPFTVTAAGYLEKYGPENRYDCVPLLSKLPCPVLILVGTESIKSSAAFDGLPEAIAAALVNQPKSVCETIDGANINYTGCDDVPFLRAAAWLQSHQWATP